MRVVEFGKQNIASELWPDADVTQLPVTMMGTLGQEGIFDVIVANHVLQYLSHREVLECLSHWNDCLSGEGEVHIIVTDATWVAERIAHSGELDRCALSVLFGEQLDASEYNHTAFTVNRLRNVLALAGFATRDARLGPYPIPVAANAEGEEGTVIARQVYVSAVKTKTFASAAMGEGE